MNNLEREVNGLGRGTEDYVRKSAELRKVSAYYREMKREITGLPKFFDRLAESAKGIVAILGVGFSLNTMASQFQRLMEMAAELSDLQSNVRKTTGMNRKEVEELTKALDELETRTSRADLLAIAEEGGRLGLPKEDILAFTEAMDKANVALGDVFASASDVASVLGKLRGLYQETREMEVGEAYNRIGSALNELGAAGQASEKNIAEFATGVGALPNAFKPSISQALALGAAFEESGIDAKVASRSYSTLIQTAAKDVDIFAKLMGRSKKEIEDLINTDPVEFFLQFTQSMSQLDKDGVKTAKALNKLGIGADGVNKIIGAGAAANERFRRTLALSAEALEEGTSLTNEFNVKNENLAATIEKIRKEFVEWATSDTVVAIIESLVTWFGKLIGAIKDADGEVSAWNKNLMYLVKIIAVIIAANLSYTASLKLITLWNLNASSATNLLTLAQKSAILQNKLVQVSLYGLSSVFYLVTGQINKARQSWIFFTAAVRSNPLGLALTVIATAATAYMVFRTETNKATKAQTALNEAMLDAEKSYADQTSRMDLLLNVAKDVNVEQSKRIEALNELKEIMPGYSDLLTLEKINTEKATQAISDYTAALQKNAKIKALTDKYSQLESEKLDLDSESVYNSSGWWQKRRTEALSIKYGVDLRDAKGPDDIQKLLEEKYKNKKTPEEIGELVFQLSVQIGTGAKYKKYSDLEDAQAAVVEELKKMGTGSAPTKGGGGVPPINLDGDEDDKAAKKLKAHMEKIWADILAIEKEKNDELRKAQRQARDERIALMDEGYEKEVQKLQAQNDDRKEDLRVEIEARNQLIKELEKKAAEERSHGHLKEAAEYSRLAKEQVKINTEKNELITLSDQTTAAKRKALWLDFQTKAFEAKKKEVEDQQKQYERELTKLQTRHNEELKSIQTLEEAKAILRDRYGYSKEELSKVRSFAKAKSEIELAQSKQTYELQADQLQAQIQKLNEVLKADELLSGTAFGALFSEEQREAILEWIERLQNELSKIDNPDKDPGAVDAENKKLGSFIDIFGFTADEWESAFQNLDTMSGKLQIAQMGVQAMTNAWNMFFQSQQRNMQRDLQSFTDATTRKKEALAKQLEEGYISQEVYNAKIAKLDADLEKKKAEMEYKSAMAEWKMSLMQAATNTALGVTSALAMTPPNFVIAAIVGAMGAVQAGLIAGNKPRKPQGYFTGGETGGSGKYDEYGRELADGPLHAREYVIPEYLRQDPVIARIEDFIEARRRGGNPRLGGSDGNGFDDDFESFRTPEESKNNAAAQSALLAAVNRLNDNLEYLHDHPLEAKMSRTMEVAKYISDDLESYKNHRTKNKR